MHAHSLFLSTGTRRPDGDAAREGNYPDEETWRRGDLDLPASLREALLAGTGRGGDFETRRIRRRSLWERNRAAIFGHAEPAGRNMTAVFGHAGLARRIIATGFGRAVLVWRNRAAIFGCAGAARRNRAARFGHAGLVWRNIGAFWHLGGGLGLQRTRGGCLRP
jgi:hypothetical protein